MGNFLARCPTRRAGVIQPFPDLDESMAGGKRRFRDISEPGPREARRVSGYTGEYAANYLTIYDGELEVDYYSADPKGAQAECDEIAASGRQVNQREAFRGSCSIHPNMKWIDPGDAAASLRDWAARPSRVEADEAILDPTQREVYDRIIERANMGRESQSGGHVPPPLRMVLLAAAGTGKIPPHVRCKKGPRNIRVRR